MKNEFIKFETYDALERPGGGVQLLPVIRVLFYRALLGRQAQRNWRAFTEQLLLPN